VATGIAISERVIAQALGCFVSSVDSVGHRRDPPAPAAVDDSQTAV
jgi:hypothetical protein